MKKHASDYIQGSVWHWHRPETEHTENGFYEQNRLALIIAEYENSQFICLEVTQNRNACFCIPLSSGLFAQCDILHVIPQNELVNYESCITDNLLKQIIDKIDSLTNEINIS